jgi:hypothetical protein
MTRERDGLPWPFGEPIPLDDMPDVAHAIQAGETLEILARLDGLLKALASRDPAYSPIADGEQEAEAMRAMLERHVEQGWPDLWTRYQRARVELYHYPGGATAGRLVWPGDSA